MQVCPGVHPLAIERHVSTRVELTLHREGDRVGQRLKDLPRGLWLCDGEAKWTLALVSDLNDVCWHTILKGLHAGGLRDAFMPAVEKCLPVLLLKSCLLG